MNTANLVYEPFNDPRFSSFTEIISSSSPCSSLFTFAGLGLLEILARGKDSKIFSEEILKVFTQKLNECQQFLDNEDLKESFEAIENLIELIQNPDYSRNQVTSWLHSHYMSTSEEDVPSRLTFVMKRVIISVINSSAMKAEIENNIELKKNTVLSILNQFSSNFRVVVKVFTEDQTLSKIYSPKNCDKAPAIYLLELPRSEFRLLREKTILEFDNQNVEVDLLAEPFSLKCSVNNNSYDIPLPDNPYNTHSNQVLENNLKSSLSSFQHNESVVGPPTTQVFQQVPRYPPQQITESFSKQGLQQELPQGLIQGLPQVPSHRPDQGVPQRPPQVPSSLPFQLSHPGPPQVPLPGSPQVPLQGPSQWGLPGLPQRGPQEHLQWPSQVSPQWPSQVLNQGLPQKPPQGPLQGLPQKSPQEFPQLPPQGPSQGPPAKGFIQGFPQVPFQGSNQKLPSNPPQDLDQSILQVPPKEIPNIAPGFPNGFPQIPPKVPIPTQEIAKAPEVSRLQDSPAFPPSTKPPNAVNQSALPKKPNIEAISDQKLPYSTVKEAPQSYFPSPPARPQVHDKEFPGQVVSNIPQPYHTARDKPLIAPSAPEILPLSAMQSKTNPMPGLGQPGAKLENNPVVPEESAVKYFPSPFNQGVASKPAQDEKKEPLNKLSGESKGDPQSDGLENPASNSNVSPVLNSNQFPKMTHPDLTGLINLNPVKLSQGNDKPFVPQFASGKPAEGGPQVKPPVPNSFASPFLAKPVEPQSSDIGNQAAKLIDSSPAAINNDCERVQNKIAISGRPYGTPANISGPAISSNLPNPPNIGSGQPVLPNSSMSKNLPVIQNPSYSPIFQNRPPESAPMAPGPNFPGPPIAPIVSSVPIAPNLQPMPVPRFADKPQNPSQIKPEEQKIADPVRPEVNRLPDQERNHYEETITLLSKHILEANSKNIELVRRLAQICSKFGYLKNIQGINELLMSKPVPTGTKCGKCSQMKENEDFTIVNCDKESNCKVCSKCRTPSIDAGCPICHRLYSDYEKETLMVALLSLNS